MYEVNLASGGQYKPSPLLSVSLALQALLPALHIFQTAVPTCLGAPLASLLTFPVPGRRWLYRNWAEVQLRTMLEQVLQWGCQQLSSSLGLKMEMGSNLFGSTPCCCCLSLYMLKDLKCGLLGTRQRLETLGEFRHQIAGAAAEVFNPTCRQGLWWLFAGWKQKLISDASSHVYC